jgi:hypothetical protein
MLNNYPLAWTLATGLSGVWIGGVSQALWLLFVRGEPADQAADSTRSWATTSKDIARSLIFPFKVKRQFRQRVKGENADSHGAPRDTWLRAAMKAALVALVGFAGWVAIAVLMHPLFASGHVRWTPILPICAIGATIAFAASIREFRRPRLATARRVTHNRPGEPESPGDRE